MMENAFYFFLKALLILCLFEFLAIYKKRLDSKDQVNFRIYGVTTWLTKTTIHILPNISRSKDNHIMKFGQLIEFNMKNVFLQKSCRK